MNQENQVSFKEKIVQFNNYEYSLQTSPPWVKYESLIYWYENILEDSEFDDAFNNITDFEVRNFSASVNEDFDFMAKKISEFLSIEIPKNLLEDFNLADCNNLEKMYGMIKAIPHTNIKNFYLHLFYEGQLFKVLDSNYYYCSNYSFNRLSYLVGIHLYHALYSVNKSFFTTQDLFKFNGLNKFCFFFYQEYWGFLTSKIINPNRKCNHYLDLKAQAKKKNKDSSDGLAIKILEDYKHIFLIKKWPTLANNFQAAKILASIFADITFDFILNIHSKNKEKEELLKLISPQKISAKNMLKLWDYVTKYANPLKVRKRVF